MNKKYYKNHICKHCGKIFYGRGTLCRKHATQLQQYGKFLDSNPRSKYDPNEIILHKNYAEIVTYNINNEPLHKFKIDLEDINRVSLYKWHSTKPAKSTQLIYLVSNDVGYYHRYIMDAKPGQMIDHINLNTFDNRKSNLRFANQTVQNHNQHCRENTRFDIKGIDQHSDINRTKRFMARFAIKGKTYRSPWFITYEEAVFARYLLEQLSPVQVINGEMQKYINKLSYKQKEPIINWFKNRFKNRV